jgi:hypothetical protein
VARYAARAPVAESRLRYDADRTEVERVSDARDGSYVGAHRMSALEFLARWVDHVPVRYETRIRYYSAYATRRRVWRRRRVRSPVRQSPQPAGPRCAPGGSAGPS